MRPAMGKRGRKKRILAYRRQQESALPTPYLQPGDADFGLLDSVTVGEKLCVAFSCYICSNLKQQPPEKNIDGKNKGEEKDGISLSHLEKSKKWLP